MRLNRSYLVLGVFLVLVVGTLIGLAYQQRIELTPLNVKNKSSSEMSSTTSVEESSATTDSEIEQQATASRHLSKQHATVSAEQNVTETDMLNEADNAIAEASYEHAARMLQELVDHHQKNTNARVQFKLAVCREALGDDVAALQAYQDAMNSTHSQPLQTAAKLGQCRIWSKNGNEQTARDELCSMLLNHRAAHSEQTEARLFNQLALAATKSSLRRDDSEKMLSDNYIHLPVAEIVVEEIIRELVQSVSMRERPEPSAEVIQDILKLDQAADSIIIEAQSPLISAAELLRQFSESTETKIEADDSVMKSLEDKHLAVSFQGIPFSVVLDVLLLPLQLTWTQSEEVISITVLNLENTPRQRLHVERLLKHALTSAPEHQLAPLCYLSLATMQHENREYQAAHREYERLLSLHPHIPFASEVWINIGKCRLALQRKDALEAFHYAVDLGSGGEVEAIAHAYLGRIYLINDTPKKALTPLQYAEALTTDAQFLIEVRLLMAAAYYLDNRSHAALNALDRCVGKLTTQRTQNEFAVLVDLIKQLTTNSTRRESEAVVLLSAISHLQHAGLFGEHWQYILARGYSELGFTEEAAKIHQEFQKRYAHLPIERRFLNLTKTQVEEMDLSEEESESPIPLAEFFLNQETSVATQNAHIQYFQEILAKENLPLQQRRVTLQKLGQLYQQRGEHALAVKCFTNSLQASKRADQEE